MRLTRRTFLAGIMGAGAAAALPTGLAEAAPADGSYATLIDLSRCDGCPDRDTPACVTACRTENAAKFPDPDPKKIKPYWPQNVYEDWTDKKHLTDRLTPYNWIFVQKLKVRHEGRTVDVSVPRRCMHCDNPPCVKLCPFGVNKKTPEGPVYIDPDFCMGGAKCRTVCPWDVPQRQAGVGVYTHLDPLPAGGGVMYKCDLCRDRLSRGQRPACVEACPKKAVTIGKRSEVLAMAKALEDKQGLYVYGREENGGTSTLYVSAVPFEAIDAAIVKAATKPEKKKPADPGKPKNMANKLRTMRMHDAKNVLERHEGKAMAVLTAPLAGIIGAFAATVSARNRAEKDLNSGPDASSGSPEQAPEDTSVEPETMEPEGKAPEGKAPEGKAPEDKEESGNE